MKRINEAVGKEISGRTETEIELAEKVRDAAVFTMMELLDGYYPNEVGNTYVAEYVLLTRIRDREGSDEPYEAIELAPNGDGLGVGFWGWRDGNFGQNR